jgi:5-methylcytosine-specific restriction protein A
MTIAASFQRVLDEYLAARAQPFARNPIAALLRDDLAVAVGKTIADPLRYLCTGSAGQGVWARGPWLAVLDRLITTSAQSGIYPVFLFREDMTGLYLSLNQGMTEAKGRYGSDAKTALRAKSADLRAFLGPHTIGSFSTDDIDLRPSHTANPSTFYEAGNVCSVFYQSKRIPRDSALKDTLLAMLDVYERAVDHESVPPLPDQLPVVHGATSHTEDGTKTRLHDRIERNPKLAAEAKRVHGFKCQACGFDYSKTYGAIGNKYIEAHHLIPLASLKGRKIALDPKADFAVLCASCHRMIHRTKFVSDIAGFKATHLGP